MKVKAASYALIPQANGIDYKFQTASGTYYNAVFGPADEFFPGTSFAKEVRMFAVRPEKGSPPAPGIDPAIGATLAEIVDRFFKQNSTGVFFYVCETNDKKELVRLRKFDGMFDYFNDEQEFIKTNFSDSQTAVHGAVICRSANPAATEIGNAASDIPSLFAD